MNVFQREKEERLDTIEMNGSEYVVLLPVDQESEDGGDGVDEVVILKIEHGDDGDDSFITVEADEELNAVFEEFKLRMEEDYDFTE